MDTASASASIDVTLEADDAEAAEAAAREMCERLLANQPRARIEDCRTIG